MIHGYKMGGSIRDLPNLEFGLDWISFLIGFCWIKMIMFYFKKIKMTLFRCKKNWVLTHGLISSWTKSYNHGVILGCGFSANLNLFWTSDILDVAIVSLSSGFGFCCRL
jgi:hypothetical protein